MIVNYHDAQRSQIDPARKRQRALTPGAFRAAHVCLGLVDRSALCYPCFMHKRSRQPLTPRLSVWGATGDPYGGRRFLTSAQFAEMRRKRADLEAKLRQLSSAERRR
jgi:hypothetical protein